MSEGEREARDIVQIKLRCREGLRAKIEEKAKANGWSINIEINRRLEESLKREEFGDDLAERVAGKILAATVAVHGISTAHAVGSVVEDKHPVVVTTGDIRDEIPEER